MKFLFERMENPLAEWEQSDYENAVRNQVQRLVEGHLLAGSDEGLDLFSLEFGADGTLMPVCDLGASAGQDHAQYAKRLEKIIGRYEPRLQRARVSVVYTGKKKDTPHLLVEGILRLPGREEQFSFPFEI